MMLQLNEKAIHLLAILGDLYIFAGCFFGLIDTSTDPNSITYWRGSMLIGIGVIAVILSTFRLICLKWDEWRTNAHEKQRK